ncbi:MAG: bifunctional diaminohydroxyphosphoribosylaminopyrimidine deaminase/5-amino-6-(5-phosphoribosylamino)uracil reductase RibD [candidate division Zixibacteria bacterium]|nr:bifunctional diaminohydroxyphosphoribosylaminopyrimidine deaminase/5-amino-6-(5-phosphoribosylamino)uracil reductase RibD [candidate division Zixibacteria bacterium]
MSVLSDAEYMKMAFFQAEKGRGTTRPNPLVGAIIVKQGEIIGKGYHKKAGQPHAEILAINKAGDNAKGSSLFLTLEPCCHTGRTGPCTDAIIKSGISRVVYAIKDPDPRVNGKGAKILRKAGIDVKSGVLKKEALKQNDIFFGHNKNNKPYLILKLAQTLDGRIATSNGDSKWISSDLSRKFAHRLRSEVDAVVVGSGTVKADNPSLTVRNFKGINPYRIVLSDNFDISPKCNLVAKNNDYKTILVGNKKNLDNINKNIKKNNLIYWGLKSNKSTSVNLHDFLAQAYQFGIKSMLVEGGATLVTSFLKENLIDKCYFITAPKLLGNGLNSISDLKISKISNALKLIDSSVNKSGDDFIISGYLNKG